MTDTHEPAEPDVPPRSRPALTLIHVLWFSTAAGCPVMAYSIARDASILARVVITIGALILGLVVTQILVFLIVVFVVIPRLEPGSYWSREVGSYMATCFPGQW